MIPIDTVPDFLHCLTSVTVPGAMITRRQFLSFNIIFFSLIFPFITITSFKSISYDPTRETSLDDWYTIFVWVVLAIVPYLLTCAVYIINFVQRLKTLNVASVLILVNVFAWAVFYLLIFLPVYEWLDIVSFYGRGDEEILLFMFFIDILLIMFCAPVALRNDNKNKKDL